MPAAILVLVEVSCWPVSFSIRPEVGRNSQKRKREVWIHQLSTGIGAFWVLICWNKDYGMIIYEGFDTQTSTKIINFSDNVWIIICREHLFFRTCCSVCCPCLTNLSIIPILCRCVVDNFVPTCRYRWTLSITPLLSIRFVFHFHWSHIYWSHAPMAPCNRQV